MAHICGYCSMCLDKIPGGGGVETRARVGLGQCCNCQCQGELYGALRTDTRVASDKKYATGPGVVRRS